MVLIKNYFALAGGYDRVIEKFAELIPDLGPEREKFPRLFASISSPIHGIQHWVRVGIHGLAIAHALREQGKIPSTENIDEAVLCAAFFHDCARLTEGLEYDHGRAGDQVWRHYFQRKEIAAETGDAVSQALLFHVDHPSVDRDANPVTICLCNADRLDRVRLDQMPKPDLMYDDGVWRELEPHSGRLLEEVSIERVSKDLGL